LATGWTIRGSNPGGVEIFRTYPDRPRGPPSLLYNGYRVSFPGVKSGQGVTLTPHPLLVPWSRKSRAIPLHSLWAVRPVQNLSVCTSVHFTFTFTQLLFGSIWFECQWGILYSEVPCDSLYVTFLGAFVKFRKANISFCHVRLSAWKNSAPNRRIFVIFDTKAFFENLLRKFKFH